MKKVNIVTFLLLPIIVIAQTTFEKTFEGKGYAEGFAICETSDGEFVATGLTRPLDKDSVDIIAVKVDNQGQLQWSKIYGGDETDRAYAILATLNGACFIAGYTQSWGESGDCYLLKINANGDTIWTKCYGRHMYDQASSMIETFDGKYVTAGYTEYGENGNYDVYLTKMDGNGQINWSKSLGEFSSEEGHAVIQAADSSFIIVGSQTVGTSSNKELMIMKTDTSGNVGWIKTYGGGKNDLARSVKQLDDNGFIITGYTQSFGVNSYNVYLIRTDEKGDTLWTRVIGDATRSEGYDVIKTVDNSFIIVGVWDSNVLLMKTDTNGDTIWTRKYATESNGFEIGRSIRQTTDGGYVIGGYYNDSPGYKLYIIKTDSEGLVTGIIYPNNQLVRNFYLHQNLPNPFNPCTVISWQLAVSSDVDLSVYNLLGQKVATIISGKQTAGYHEVEFNGQNLSSGVYLYRIEAGDWQDVRKMVLLK
jgi:flagellar hook assembly protein FlgD